MSIIYPLIPPHTPIQEYHPKHRLPIIHQKETLRQKPRHRAHHRRIHPPKITRQPDKQADRRHNAIAEQYAEQATMNLIDLACKREAFKTTLAYAIQQILWIQHQLLHPSIQKEPQQSAVRHLPDLLLNPGQHIVIHRLHIKIRCRPYPP